MYLHLVSLFGLAVASRVKNFQAEDSECITDPCAAAITDSTLNNVVECKNSAPSDCVFTGTFVYEDEALRDVVADPWRDGLMVGGPSPVKSSHELNGFISSMDATMNFGFKYVEASEPAVTLRCFYLVQPTIAQAPTLVPPELGPNQNCEGDGLPMQYRLSSTMEVLTRTARVEASLVSKIDANSLLIPYQSELHILIESIQGYGLERISVDGTMDFVIHGIKR